MNSNDKDFVAGLAGFITKAEKIEKDACQKFMDRARAEHKKENSNEPMYTGD